MDSEAGFRPGEVVLKKYLIEEILGEGGMGLVYKAKHLRIGESVALKVLHPGWAADPTVVARFEQEARSSIRIRNEHVARVMDIETLPSGAPLMVMELLQGRDLSDEILGRQVPVDEAVDLMLQACTALAEAHSLGIIHRDIKPANLFLTRRADGTRLLKVLDFGIAKALDNVPDDTSLTRTQDVIGSPMYMSPEQIRSSKNVDQRTDIWALGVILFEMLSGDTPFGGETSPAVLAAISADEPRALPGNVESPALKAVIAKALAKRPNDRYQNVAEFAAALATLSPGFDNTVLRIHRVVHGQLAAPDSFQQTARHGGERAADRKGTTTSDPTVLDESGRYSPLSSQTGAIPTVSRTWLLWGGAALVLVLIAGMLALTSQEDQGEPPKPATTAIEPADQQAEPKQATLPEPEDVKDVSPPPSENPAPEAPPIRAPAPKQARPSPVTAAPRKPAPSPVPQPAAGSLIDEATESRK